MGKQTINLGTVANDGTGTPLRTAGEMINENFDELYAGDAGYVVSETLPETIPQGRQVLYNGTMWRGLLEGESSLEAGTPWPVKGYKEWTAKLSITGASPFIQIQEVSTDTIFLGTELSFEANKPASVGSYYLKTDSVLPENSYSGLAIVDVSYTGGNDFLLTRSSFVRSGPPYSYIGLIIQNFNGELVDVSASSLVVSINFKLYPPAP